MNEIAYRFPYWGPLVLEVEVKDELISLLLEKGKESRGKNLDHSKHLAGVIDNQYYYEDFEEWFCPLFDPYINAYINTVSDYKTDCFKNPPDWWKVDSLWINYQKPLEYNPPHNHDGDLSFVIYLQVPEEIEQENERAKGNRRNSGPGTIIFDIGPDMPLSISCIRRMPKAGQAFIFPAWLPHHVNPFKSDVERISVSGNINLFK
jgi:hypothetical protein